MISEKQFAKNYTTFWRNLLPLSNLFIKHVPKEVEKVLKTTSDSYVDPSRKFLISQISFYLLQGDMFSKAVSTDIDECFKKAENYFRNNYSDVDNRLNPLNEHEKKAIYSITEQLGKYYTKNHNPDNILFNPRFNGCGIVNSCYGDIYSEGILYELKTVKRGFQLIDFKQLIIYCALNSMSHQYQIKKIALLNPLHGDLYISEIDDFSYSICGKNSVDLFDDIIQYISSTGISK